MIKKFNKFKNENVDYRELDIKPQANNYDDSDDGMQSILDKYEMALNDILDRLPGSYIENRTVHFEDKEIIFPSETDTYHIDSKQFKTPEEVVDYLKSNGYDLD